MATSQTPDSNRLEDLVAELHGLVPSAASSEACEKCSLLGELAGPLPPRALLDRAIEHLRQAPGRTTDGDRRNYSFAVVGAAIDAAIGPDAANRGLEKRYLQIGEAMGNSTAISGRRALDRLMRHLAVAVFTVAKSSNSETPQRASVRSSIPIRLGPPLDDLDRLDDMLQMALEKRLVARRAWREALAVAVADAYQHEEGGLQAVENYQDQLERMEGSELRIGAQTMLLRAGLRLSEAPRWVAAASEDLVGVLQSRDLVGELGTSTVCTREDAASALDAAGVVRPGTGVARLNSVTLPCHRFVRLPAPHRTTLLSVYPTTLAQYRCFDPNHEAGETTASAPVVDVTLHDALAYCEWLGDMLREIPELEISKIGGGLTTIPTSNVSLRLPTANEATAAGSSARGPFSWSHSTDSTVGLSRRRLYNHLLPVGLFPDELSSTGALDLSGLIWQWTSDDWGPGPTGYKAVFGGGYRGAERFLENGFMLGAAPNTRRSDRGFRIVAVTQ